ncbi:hypothetical protein M9H77_25371 [Catharanthus roseus]|uniref:Uncharacterized protein n=1 Tax=Catharanthus roseus TaxID=4058 RepID=A0ACC0A6Q1_CATRO|nr:hypothetical protein M9H77_25371 [Catharanthus roseus]
METCFIIKISRKCQTYTLLGSGLLQFFLSYIVARTRNPDWRFDHEPIPTLGGFLINNCKSNGNKNHRPAIWKSVYTWRETPENKFENIIKGTACSDLQGSGDFGTLLLLGHCHHPIHID